MGNSAHFTLTRPVLDNRGSLNLEQEAYISMMDAVRTWGGALPGMALVLVCSCSMENRSQPPSTGVRTVEGQVVAIDLSDMALDGPGVVRVEPDDGTAVDVLISACEGPCSREANEVLRTLSVGDRIFARGREVGDGKLVINDDGLHSIRVLEP